MFEASESIPVKENQYCYDLSIGKPSGLMGAYHAITDLMKHNHLQSR